MNFSKIQNLTKEKTVLVIPLDWGLGHATRCVPIIKQLICLNCKVLIGATGAQKKILADAFPGIEIIALEGYKIKYSKNRRLFLLALLLQFPKIFRTIFKEHDWLKKINKERKIDAVISDNRFGLYHATLPCVYITHQVALKTGVPFLDSLASRIHLNIINRFGRCWIPDFEEFGYSLAGELSHPVVSPKKVTYTGCLSRFEVLESRTKIFEVVAVVSGPEPQRTIFEKLLLKSLGSCKGKVLLIRGLPEALENLSHLESETLVIKNHLDLYDLNEVITQAEIVICRSGYTSIMDLVKLKQKAILIPTPGQTEQEYLADYLQEKNFFYSLKQENFDLERALEGAKKFPFNFPAVDMDQYKEAVTQFVQSL